MIEKLKSQNRDREYVEQVVSDSGIPQKLID